MKAAATLDRKDGNCNADLCNGSWSGMDDGAHSKDGKYSIRVKQTEMLPSGFHRDSLDN